MSEQPINDEHIEFAHDLVALARKHGASQLTVSFSLSGSRRFFEDRANWQQITFAWSEGRHGDRSGFQLRGEASVRVDERNPSTDTALTENRKEG